MQPMTGQILIMKLEVNDCLGVRCTGFGGSTRVSMAGYASDRHFLCGGLTLGPNESGQGGKGHEGAHQIEYVHDCGLLVLMTFPISIPGPSKIRASVRFNFILLISIG